VGLALRRLGPGRAIAVGLAVAACGLALVAAAERSDSLPALLAALVPVGLGVGLAMTLTTDAVVSAVPPHRAGAAAAISETAYELGVALGIAVLGSVVTLVYRRSLELPALPAEVHDRVRDSLASALSVLEPGSAAAVAAAEAFTTAMQVTSLVAAAVTAVAALVAWRTVPSPRPGGTLTGQQSLSREV
ncbi:MFS transporter, partial [Desertihabitans aurantiacus]|uniref:MFS transporter n=1 Tax=Desertihabitans aurantiacus TaxID=2282477 RepID=UPI002FCDBD93